MMDEFGHVENEFLVLVFGQTLFEQFEVKFCCLVINTQRSHLGFERLVADGFLSLELLFHLPFDLLFADFFKR